VAIVVETLIRQATKAEAEHFDELVENAMTQAGGPPAGFMVHFTRPHGDGFLMVNVWRSENDMQPFYNSTIRPKLAEAGLTGDPPVVSPIWVFARP
jgi:hypothetical protein